MNRWAIGILFVTLGLRLISGGMMLSAHAADMDVEPCDRTTCGVTGDQCFEHCLAMGYTDTVLPAITPGVFFLTVGVLAVALVAITVAARPSIRSTALAPPGLAFVRTTVLRE